jgi:hypothetical protein
MGDDDWDRGRPPPLLVDEVDADAIHDGEEVGKAVDRPLLRPPVETCLPVLDQVRHEFQVGAVFPARGGDLVGPARAGQALAQVVEYHLRDVHHVRLHLHRVTPCHPHPDAGPALGSGGSHLRIGSPSYPVDVHDAGLEPRSIGKAVRPRASSISSRTIGPGVRVVGIRPPMELSASRSV